MTPQVVITIDPHKLLSAKTGVFVVSTIADFLPACLALRDAIHISTKTRLEIHIQNAIVASWLSTWARSYGPDHVTIKTWSPRDALTQLWGIEIPHTFESEILSAGLLNLQITPREGQSFETVILEHFYHDFFAYPSFPVEHFVRFLNQVDPTRWQTNSKRPLVTRIFHQRLELWKTKETNEARLELISRLARDLTSIRQNFAAFKILRSYQLELAVKVLGPDYELFQRAQINPDQLEISNLDLSPIIRDIEYYLTAQLPTLTDPASLTTLLGQMSGHLLPEYNFIYSFLQTHPDWLDADLIRQIERRFSPLRRGLGSRLAKMRSLVAVQPPSAPDLSWGPAEWLAWVVNQYMPHHHWLELQRYYDETTAKYAESFADWYFTNYIDLKNGTPQHFAFSALYLDRQRFTEGDGIALVLILDNFNYSFFPILRRLFNQSEIALMEERPVLVLPPTATEVDKASLIAVTGDLTAIDTKDYAKLVDQIWGRILAPTGKSVGYLSSIGDLQNLTERNHDLYFLNYLPVDEALHDSSQKIGMDHPERVHSLLENLVSSITEFAHRFHIEKRLIVYLISDHGSTRIAKNVVNILDKKFYKNISDLQHHRYMSLSDKQLSEIPQAVEAQCYLIKRSSFKTQTNYLAARAYYRFVETSEDFYVHGGLTPEEIVVPFARFTFQPQNVLPPTLRILKSQYRFAIKSIVEFELGNPNTFALKNISVQLVDQASDEVLVESLGPKSPLKIAFSTVFKRIPGAGNAKELMIRVFYECQERTFPPVEFMVPISLKGMVEETDDFKF